MLEDQWIQQLQAAFPLPNGIGDDAAILPFNDSTSYVVTQDLLVEDIHFRRHYFSPQHLAHKALHANLSDIAAMGASPSFVFLGISIPPQTDVYTKDFLESFCALCQKHQLALMGGDTTASPHDLLISVTLIGTVPHTHIKRRNTAKPGDIICVIGNLGYSLLGLTALENNEASDFTEYALKPQAKIQEGSWLGAQSAITSLMDLSDGLYTDLNRLCLASQVHASIAVDQLGYSDLFLAECQKHHQNPHEIALSGGEDYGLLFTVSPTQLDSLKKHFQKTFCYDIQVIGEIAHKHESEPTLRFTENGQATHFKLNPFKHFDE